MNNESRPTNRPVFRIDGATATVDGPLVVQTVDMDHPEGIRIVYTDGTEQVLPGVRELIASSVIIAGNFRM